ESLKVSVLKADFSDADHLARLIQGHEVVYNCTANVKFHLSMEDHRAVEVHLTRRLALAAVKADARRFVQLSTIKVYGCDLPAKPVDESYLCKPEFPFEKVSLEREQVVQEVAAQAGLNFAILRPAGTIGNRDTSFLSFLYKAHRGGSFPMIGDGTARMSLVDTRDIGRAMVWLGTLPEARGQVYLLRAYEATWMDLKEAIDRVRGVTAKVRRLPPGLAMGLARFFEWVTPYGGSPWLTRLAVRSMTANALFDDSKIRRGGFATIHDSLEETLSNAIADLEGRKN
ncbi:MAG: NAD-dependent epimerase/dehydratase family protein, partial [Nitrospirae bacterium]|nr:NAD-dependent epimerase/dehydratase family protein [Nitrospirota bacterium]